MLKDKWSKVTPMILAGGKSRRMGKNKSFVALEGKPMIEIVVEKVKDLFLLPPVLITNSPEVYNYLGLEMVEDIIKEKGPLGGIHAGLRKSSSQFIFIFGCDMPFLNQDLINYMVEQIENEDIIIPRHGQCLEPLHAIYSKNCLPLIEEQLNLGFLKIQSFFPQAKIRYIQKEEIELFESGLDCFSNINTREDLEDAQLRWKGENWRRCSDVRQDSEKKDRET